MHFAQNVTAIEGTIRAELGIERRNSYSSADRIDWYLGPFVARLEIDSVQTVALSKGVENAEVPQLSYPLAMLGAWDVARVIAALGNLDEAYQPEG